MLRELLTERDLLPVLTHQDGSAVTPESWSKRREEMREALELWSYGHTLPKPRRVWGEVLTDRSDEYAGKVREQILRISFETERGVFSFPTWICIPNQVEKPPVFLHIAFRPGQPDRYTPVEEITDAGYAVAVVCYEDLVNDRLHGDYSDGLAAYFGTVSDRRPDEWGKIGMWAYGASRFMDYLMTRDDLDTEHVAVIGHSRLGKTALWTAAQDERFWCAISNNSRNGGGIFPR